MAVVAARAEHGEKHHSSSAYCIELGILNNMPDAALERTEQQFFSLLTAAAQDLLVRVRFFSLSTLPRDSARREHLARHVYAPAVEIPSANLDALIITGTEPRANDLRLEPYWGELKGVFDFVAQEGPATIFSCLAAHAAVLHYDGVERRRLAEKRFGVFEHVVSRNDPLTQNLSSPFRIAHSRWNELAESDLAAAGYRILTWSADAGVDLFQKRGRTDLLFAQGHPEYDAMTLAREFRRDVRRWLRGETDVYPPLPKNYFSAGEALALAQFRARAIFERSEALMAVWPSLSRKPDSRWNAPGAAVVRAWLQAIVGTKRTERPARAVNAPHFATEAA
ncbi:MAG TPA: homoserine O-succinyltransferase [Rhizomicrobium sp.]|nr:homoserine O-succinyltransferase [Rhizomicrobium sp.]